MSDTPRKVFVDDDWKKEAQKEKERLKEEIDHSAPEAGEMPEANFTALVNLLATQSVACLGGMGAKPGEPIQVDPMTAKLFIDLLAVLEEKTKGNLSAEEAALLKRVLSDLRMSFVHILDALSRQANKGPMGAVKPAPGPAPQPPSPSAPPAGGPKIILD